MQVYLGEYKEKSKIEFQIPVQAVSVNSVSCGCVGAKIEKGLLKGFIKTAPIPEHLKSQGWYESFKIVYLNGTPNEVKLKYKIVK